MAPPQPLTLTVRPRLQREMWSLYWREAMATETSSARDVTLPIGEQQEESGESGNSNGNGASPAPAAVAPLPATATVRDALRAAAAALGWPPVGSLVRLEGFELPFERCLFKGVEVGLDEPAAKFAFLAAAGAGEGAESDTHAAATAAAKPPAPLVYVRTVLAAEGWRLANDPDDPAGYSTSDSEEDD